VFVRLDRDAWGSAGVRRSIARAGAAGALLLVTVEGPLYNPRGFAARLRYLVGPASAPFAPYSDDLEGRGAVLVDVLRRVGSAYPAPLLLLAGAGLIFVILDRRRAPRRFAAGTVPLLGIASFTLAFNCLARRADHRFVLPQVVLLAVYGGIGIEGLLRGIRRVPLRRIALAAVLVAFLPAAYAAADVEANVLLDPRYAAERWLRDHAMAGDLLETYGLNVYLPRTPPSTRVERVGTDPVANRSPLPGVQEIEGPLIEAHERGARFLVVPEAWAGRYLATPHAGSAGRVAAANETESARDADACAFFRALREDPGRLGYRLAFTAAWDHPLWPRLDIHASTAPTVWIYERRSE